MWQFCPHCSSSLTDQSLEKYGVCTVCGHQWFRAPKPAVGALIVDNNKILLARRAINPKKGTWDTPGGFLSGDETPEEGMRREIKEEMNVEPTNLEIFDFEPNIYQYEEELFIALDIFFLVTLAPAANPQPADDVAELKWFDLKDPLPEMAFESPKAAIAKLLRKRNIPRPRA